LSRGFAAKRIRAAVLYGRIRNYSKIVNILSLEEIHSFLNDSYGVIVDAVLKHKGAVDKFTGDGVTAVFGKSTVGERDSAQAVKAALSIQEELEQVNIKWRGSLNFLVEVDIGISTGELLLGNVGHIKHFEYTVIGEKITLAEQLASLCKTFNVEIILDETTCDEVKEEIRLYELGKKLILGFPEPVKLYTPKPRL